MPACPSCRRPIAIARATCLYCGAALDPDLLPGPAPGPAAAAHPGPDVASGTEADSGSLLVLDLRWADPATLAAAASVSPYEAAQWVRRGGFHLLRAPHPQGAEVEAARLRAAGIGVFLVPASEARPRPLHAVGGERQGDRLILRTLEGIITLVAADLLLVVRGPIVREYQPVVQRRLGTATLTEGYRLHLHRRHDPRPVEIEASHFEAHGLKHGSARLTIEAWIDAVAAGVPQDDGFRRLPPALGPAAPEPEGPLAAAGALTRAARGRRERAAEPIVLDNAEQFRFYSGWRAAVERRL